MRSLFTLFIVMMSLSSPTLCQEMEKTEPPTKEEITKAVFAGDIDGVENMLAGVQAQYLQGDVDRNHLRWLFEPFGTNSPKIVEFTADWLKEHPESPYAHTAQAWIYYRTAAYIRGEKTARKTYYKALREYDTLNKQAWEHAEFAYEMDKRLLPASDALLRLANSTGKKLEAFNVLEDTMQTDPNIGSLRRALDMTIPGWGGSWEMVEGMCDYYGAMIVERTEYDPVTFCKAMAASYYYRKEKWNWLRETLQTSKMPALEYVRVEMALYEPTSREDAQLVYDYLNREGVTNAAYAREFDRFLASEYGFDFIQEAHLRRAHNYSLKAIKQDPYNPEILKLLQRGIVRTFIDGQGAIDEEIIKPLTREEEVDYFRRLFIAEPYNPKNWIAAIWVLFDYDNPNDFMKDDAFWINAVVYSNYDKDILNKFVRRKTNYHGTMDFIDRGIRGSEWHTVRDGIDRDRDINCPMVHAYRLREYICNGDPEYPCGVNDRWKKRFDKVRNDKVSSSKCIKELYTPASMLSLTPVEVDLDTLWADGQ